MILFPISILLLNNPIARSQELTLIILIPVRKLIETKHQTSYIRCYHSPKNTENNHFSNTYKNNTRMDNNQIVRNHFSKWTKSMVNKLLLFTKEV